MSPGGRERPRTHSPPPSGGGRGSPELHTIPEEAVSATGKAAEAALGGEAAVWAAMLGGAKQEIEGEGPGRADSREGEMGDVFRINLTIEGELGGFTGENKVQEGPLTLVLASLLEAMCVKETARLNVSHGHANKHIDFELFPECCLDVRVHG